MKGCFELKLHSDIFYCVQHEWKGLLHMLQLPKFVLFTKCKLSRLVTTKSLGFGRLNVLGFLMLELWFSLGHWCIFTKVQFFKARRFLLNSFHLAWQPLSSSCFRSSYQTIVTSGWREQQNRKPQSIFQVWRSSSSIARFKSCIFCFRQLFV